MPLHRKRWSACGRQWDCGDGETWYAVSAMRTALSLVLGLFLLGGVALPPFVPSVGASSRTLSFFLERRAPSRRVVALSPRVVALSEVEGASTMEPGSVPLRPALEQRLQRYITNDNCPVTFDRAVHERCQYLLKQERKLLSDEHGGARLSPRAQGVRQRIERGMAVRRTIGGDYQRRLQSAAEALFLRVERGGFRRRLRTIQDVQERYEGLSVERSRGETRVRPAPPPPPPPPPAEGG